MFSNRMTSIIHVFISVGIKKGVVAVPSRFTVDTKNAGPGDLSVAVEGPSKVDIDCVDNGDGTCEVTYVPVEAGSSFFISSSFIYARDSIFGFSSNLIANCCFVRTNIKNTDSGILTWDELSKVEKVELKGLA